MLKIAICDDEKEQQQILERLITSEQLSEPYELDKFDSGEDLVSVYEAGQRFSIILLDMKMKELDGIQTAEIIRKYEENCIIIIITSIIEYAVNGYSVEAYDFILKPVDEKKFSKVFKSAVKIIQEEKNKIYVIQMRDKITALRLPDIVYLESDKRKVIIHCKKGKYSDNENISNAEKKLSTDGFVRISRYYLVNMQHIEKIAANSIMMSTGDLLKYSKNYQKEIKIKYMNFVMGDIE
jgi:DNA-binding LytR/AlgR family response regulator